MVRWRASGIGLFRLVYHRGPGPDDLVHFVRKLEQKRAAGFPFVRPFEPPAATTNSTRAGAEGAMELTVDNGDSATAPCVRRLGDGKAIIG